MNVYAAKKPRRLNAFSLSLITITAAIIYLGIALGPAYYSAFQATSAMRAICNEAYRNFNDEEVNQHLLDALKKRGVYVTKEYALFSRGHFTPQEVAGENEDFRQLLAQRGNRCYIQVRYNRQVHFPIVGISKTITFDRIVDREIPRNIKW